MAADRLYQDNPFRILGLRVTAGAAEIAARGRQPLTATDAGRGASGVADIRASLALRSLADPTERLRAELYWLHGETAEAPPTLDLDDRDAVARALAALGRAADERDGDPGARAIARHDLAVVSHAACLRHRWLGPDLVAALERWSAVFADDAYWRHLTARARVLGMTQDPVPLLRQHLADTLMTALIDAITTLLDEGHDGAALALVMELKLSALPRATIEQTVREVTLPFRATLRTGVNALVALVDALGELPEATPAIRLRQQVERATACLRDEVLIPLRRLRRLAPEADDAALADRAAKVTARLASLVVTRLGDRPAALALAGEAVALARTGAVRDELVADQRRLGHDHHRELARAAFAGGDLVTTLAHCQLALPLATSAEDDAAIRQAIAATDAALDDRGRQRAQALAREIAAHLPKRIELPRAPRAPRLATGGLLQSEAPAASETDTIAGGPPAAADTAPGAGAPSTEALPPPASEAAIAEAVAAPAVASALRRGAVTLADTPARTPPANGRAPSILRRLSDASGGRSLALPAAAALLLAVAATSLVAGGGLPWAGTGAGTTADDAPATSTRAAGVPGGSGTDDFTPSQSGGVLTEADPIATGTNPCLAAGGSASSTQVDDLRESIAALDDEIAAILTEYPDGRLPADAAEHLTALRDARVESAEALADLLAGATDENGGAGRTC